MRMVLPWRLSDHLLVCMKRIVTCQYCALEVTFDTLHTHEENCPEKVIPCPNGCCAESGEVTRFKQGDRATHLQTCPAEEIQCCYATLGCPTVSKRVDMPAHERDPKHMELLMRQLLDHKRRLERLECSPVEILWKLHVDDLDDDRQSNEIVVKGYKVYLRFVPGYPEGSHMLVLHVRDSSNSGNGNSVAEIMVMHRCEVGQGGNVITNDYVEGVNDGFEAIMFDTDMLDEFGPGWEYHSFAPDIRLVVGDLADERGFITIKSTVIIRG
jgi:TRAF-type zinc finger